ncbi:hypothetical protein GA0070606_2584 [Micromonospora citrea]|uniref:DUF4303 domain-containing protein n=1 Tax=Micromonospora citrea TaxID=47855 RepID=A0A1C6UQG8_9ACTN|nr:DUF4303 domain-containing protein [Micromonospora citrea]SCL56305.1 hypothetical protein GA0070606_2584 [Micromonospora citrea]
MDWDAFEAAWHDNGCRSLAGLAAAHPDERLYAAAFHLFYSDGVQILPPALAANAEAEVSRDHGYSTRFAPAEWRWDVLDAASDAMRPWYHRLSEEFLGPAGTDADRDAAMETLEAAHDDAMARVCRAMTVTARRGGIHDLLPADFVVVILDGQRGDEEADLIRASVDPLVLATAPGLAGHLRECAEA